MQDEEEQETAAQDPRYKGPVPREHELFSRGPPPPDSTPLPELEAELCEAAAWGELAALRAYRPFCGGPPVIEMVVVARGCGALIAASFRDAEVAREFILKN